MAELSNQETGEKILQERLQELGMGLDLAKLLGRGVDQNRKVFAERLLACAEEKNEEGLEVNIVAFYISKGVNEATLNRVRELPPEFRSMLFDRIRQHDKIALGDSVEILYKAYIQGIWTLPMILAAGACIKNKDNFLVPSFLSCLLHLKTIYRKDESLFAEVLGELEKISECESFACLKRSISVLTTIGQLKKGVVFLVSGNRESFDAFYEAKDVYDKSEELEELCSQLITKLNVKKAKELIDFLRRHKPLEVGNPYLHVLQQWMAEGDLRSVAQLTLIYASFPDPVHFESFAQAVKGWSEWEIERMAKSTRQILELSQDEELFNLLLTAPRDRPMDITELLNQYGKFYRNRLPWIAWMIKLFHKGKLGYSGPLVWAKLHEKHADQPKRVQAIATLVTRYGESVISFFSAYEAYFDSDEDNFNALLEIVGSCGESSDKNAISKLIDAHAIAGDDLKRLRFLNQKRGTPDEDVLFKIVDLLFERPMAQTSQIDLDTALNYMKEAPPVFRERDLLLYVLELEKKGIGEGLRYVESLIPHWEEWRKEIVSEERQEKHRGEPYYRALMVDVFGLDTEYSNIDDAIATDDALEHLEGYQFPEDKRTSETSLSIQNGYKLSEGRKEKLDALSAYKKRVDEAIHGEFDLRSRLESAYKTTKIKQHLPLEGLTDEELLVAILLDQNIQKDHLDERIDLMLTYRFSKQEDWSDYANNSGESVLGQPNEVSQRYQEWVELESLYGENMQHTFQHEVNKKVRWSLIREAFLKALKEKKERKSCFEERHKQRIMDILTNDRIPALKKSELIKRNIMNVFLSVQGVPQDILENFASEARGVVDHFLASNDQITNFEGLVPLVAKLEDIFFMHNNSPHKVIRDFISRDFLKIRQAISDYEENLVGSEQAGLVAVYTKTQESAAARMSAGLCVGADEKMYPRENYFEEILKDKETGKCMGLVMHLSIKQKDGKKYLWFGPNPSEDCLKKFGEREIFQFLKRKVIDFARVNGYDGVLVPKGTLFGPCTNRGGKFLSLLEKSRIKTNDGFKEVHFDEPVVLAEAPYEYEYTDGVLIWEKQGVMGSAEEIN